MSEIDEDHPIYRAIDMGGGQTCDIRGVIRELNAAGFVIVPRKPTEKMVAAATWPIVYDSSGAGTNRSPRQAWELMIDEALK